MKRILFLTIFLTGGVITAVSVLNEKIFEFHPAERSLLIPIPAGANFASLAINAGLSTSSVSALIDQAKAVYDLATIVSGKNLELIFDFATDTPKKLIYKVDSEKQLLAQLVGPDQWRVEIQPIPYETKISQSSGVIETSLYETVTAQGLDERLALALAETFAWQIDFAADIQKGDGFKAIYENRYLNGNYAMPGKILAAEFQNAGATFWGFYFTSSTTKAGYYDIDGNSLQKVFLKSPLQYKYISSGYSYARVNPITKKVAPHRGIDYAANYGTPAVSVGDGTVVQAGWNGPYGISALVRHNETYSSRYGHFQSLAKGIRVGAKVKQGQVVGYVGSTGESTGPHLHYEMHKFGSHVNPFRVEVPPGEPIDAADREAFNKIVLDYLKKLSEI